MPKEKKSLQRMLFVLIYLMFLANSSGCSKQSETEKTPDNKLQETPPPPPPALVPVVTAKPVAPAEEPTSPPPEPTQTLKLSIACPAHPLVKSVEFKFQPVTLKAGLLKLESAWCYATKGKYEKTEGIYVKDIIAGINESVELNYQTIIVFQNEPTDSDWPPLWTDGSIKLAPNAENAIFFDPSPFIGKITISIDWGDLPLKTPTSIIDPYFDLGVTAQGGFFISILKKYASFRSDQHEPYTFLYPLDPKGKEKTNLSITGSIGFDDKKLFVLPDRTFIENRDQTLILSSKGTISLPGPEDTQVTVTLLKK